MRHRVVEAEVLDATDDYAYGDDADLEPDPVQGEYQETRPAGDSSDHLWHYKQIDLTKRYHIEARYSFQKSFSLFLGSVGLWLFYLTVYGLEGLSVTNDALQHVVYLAVRLSFFVFLGRYLYWELYRRAFEYRTEGFRLLISRGLMTKLQGSIPLLPITSIYVKRSPLDLLFGLYQLHVISPADASPELGSIEGLNRENAYALHHFLTEQLNRQVSVSSPPEYDPRTGERMVIPPVRNDLL